MAKKRIHFVSLGCPKNRVDTEVMVGVAGEQRWELTSEADEAEVIVVNTCGFIGEAKKESIETIFEMAELKKLGACKKLVVTGCLSQRYPQELESQMPEVDHFLGSSDMLSLGKVLADPLDVAKRKVPRMLVGNPADWVMKAESPRVVTGSTASAYLKIAEGCNRACAFCTIPQFRGKQRSRTADDVVREASHLAAQGIVELNLISQDTVSWGRDLPKAGRESLARLVERVADVAGVRWVRVFYLYPETIDEALLDLLASHPRVVPYVDMPLQHASDAMLARMKRGHGKDRQKRVVERLRKHIPGLFLRTAFIVGHPGETDADFAELVDFVEWGQFDNVGVFKYSDEETAKSFAQDGKLRPVVVSNRWRKLMSLQRKIARRNNKRLVGREMDVLVEGPSEEHELVMAGRHAGQAPDVDGKVYLGGGEVTRGEMRRVRITQSADYDLVGDVIDDPPPRAAAAAKPKKRALPVFGSQLMSRGA
ncbi:MAG: 30S ribosomal protein S12 methylthiotransferase RimO [Labilithrix sp.]|nr:30S ribosomal protein S12 methylthiotransferase RimO [Labilithrix sp.]MCW5814032.1 30S ribosomal protein S12 methylthiotransferase RimO [Labilithrix sp.]